MADFVFCPRRRFAAPVRLPQPAQLVPALPAPAVKMSVGLAGGRPPTDLDEGDEEELLLLISGMGMTQEAEGGGASEYWVGEQVEECPPGVGVDGLRRLHHGFEELDTNGMSELAERCREAGLESLFLTSMKIYRDDDAGDKVGSSGGSGGGGGGAEIGGRNKSKGNKR